MNIESIETFVILSENGELIQVKFKGSLPPTRQIYMLLNKNKEDSIAIKSFLEIINVKK